MATRRAKRIREDDIEKVLAGIMDGRALTAILPESRISEVAWYTMVRENRFELATRYPQARRIAAERRLDDVWTEMQTTPATYMDAAGNERLDASRSALLLRHAHWMAERLVPELAPRQVHQTEDDEGHRGPVILSLPVKDLAARGKTQGKDDGE